MTWRTVKLGEVIREYQPGFACGERKDNGLIQLRMNNVDTRGNFVWDDVTRIPPSFKDVDEYLLQAGDVLFNNTNSTELVGKSALFKGFTEPVTYSNHFTRLRTYEDALLPGYLVAWLVYQWQQGVFARICNRWIGQSAVKSGKLLNLLIDLPPVDVQRQVIEELEKRLASIDIARAAAKKQLDMINSLPGAFLRKIFEVKS